MEVVAKNLVEVAEVRKEEVIANNKMVEQGDSKMEAEAENEQVIANKRTEEQGDSKMEVTEKAEAEYIDAAGEKKKKNDGMEVNQRTEGKKKSKAEKKENDYEEVNQRTEKKKESKVEEKENDNE